MAKDYSKLTKKTIVGKDGKPKTVWVKMNSNAKDDKDMKRIAGSSKKKKEEGGGKKIQDFKPMTSASEEIEAHGLKHEEKK